LLTSAQRTGYIRNDAGFLEIGELYDFDVRAAR